MNQEIMEIKNTYYEYVSKVGAGCQYISNVLRKENYEDAFQSIIDFSEGVEWLVSVEEMMDEQGWIINSRVNEAKEFLIEINTAIENQDFILVADLFEYEIQPIFSSASEWIFVQEG